MFHELVVKDTIGCHFRLAERNNIRHPFHKQNEAGGWRSYARSCEGTHNLVHEIQRLIQGKRKNIS